MKLKLNRAEIAELFRRDPNAVIGHYKSRDDFVQICRQEGHYRVQRDKSISLDFINHARS